MRTKTWLLALVLFVAPSAFANDVSVTLTSPGDGATLGDVYVDPYTATVGNSVGVSVICDDWSNNSYLGESWTASVTSLSNVSSGMPMFGNNQGLYNELAWLGSQLLANPTNSTLQTEISFAMWDLTYGVNSTSEESPAPLTYLSENLTGGTSNSEYTATLNYITLAEGESTYNSSGWEILTPDGSAPTCGGGSCPTDPPQEFLVYTPEPSSLLLLVIGLLAISMMYWRRSAAIAR